MPPSRRIADVSTASKVRNEYIPSFITKKPFFIDDSKSGTSDYLEHQRLQKHADDANFKYEDRAKKRLKVATKFRKGACENCGAMGHQARECLSRPRKLGARWTNRDIAPDEVREAKLERTWDEKRDQYAAYDPSEYEKVIQEYQALDEMKRAANAERKRRGKHKTDDINNPSNEDFDDDDYDDDDDTNVDDQDAEGTKYEEEADMGRNQPTSTKNLRIREDVAGYLRSLDPESAKYDPKARRMVDSGAIADQASALVAEQGFLRASGDAAVFERAQVFAWEMQSKGGPDKERIHLQANPTSAEFLIKKKDEERALQQRQKMKSLLERYGGAEHLNANS